MEMQHASSPWEPGAGSEVAKASARPRLRTVSALLNKRQVIQGLDTDGSPLFPQDGDQFRAMLGSPLPPLYSPRLYQPSPRRTTITSPGRPANHRPNVNRGDGIDRIISAFDPGLASSKPLFSPTAAGLGTPRDAPMNQRIGLGFPNTITTPAPRMLGALDYLPAQPSNPTQQISPRLGQHGPASEPTNIMTGPQEAGCSIQEDGSDTGSGCMNMPTANILSSVGISCAEQLAAAALRGPARRIALRDLLPYEASDGGHGFSHTQVPMTAFGVPGMVANAPFVFGSSQNGCGTVPVAPHLSDGGSGFFGGLGGGGSGSNGGGGGRLQLNVNDMLLARESDGSLLPPAPPLNLGSGLDMNFSQPLSSHNLDVFATPRSLLGTADMGAIGGGMGSYVDVAPASGSGRGSEAEGGEAGRARSFFQGTTLPLAPLQQPPLGLPPGMSMMMMMMGAGVGGGANVPSPQSLEPKHKSMGSYPSSNEESRIAVAGGMNVESGASRTTDTSGGVELLGYRSGCPPAVVTATGTAVGLMPGTFQNLLGPGTAGFIPIGDGEKNMDANLLGAGGRDTGTGTGAPSSGGPVGGGAAATAYGGPSCENRYSRALGSSSLAALPQHLGMMPVSNGNTATMMMTTMTAMGPSSGDASRVHVMSDASHSAQPTQPPPVSEDTNQPLEPPIQHLQYQQQQQQQQQQQLVRGGSGMFLASRGSRDAVCERPGGGGLPPRGGGGGGGGMPAAAVAAGNSGGGGVSTPSTLRRPHRTRTATMLYNGVGVVNEGTTSTQCIAPMDFDGTAPEPEPSPEMGGPAHGNGNVHRSSHGSGGVQPLAPNNRGGRRGSESNNIKSCRCKKSLCLKLYCDCFAAGQYCDNCSCIACRNRPEHSELVQQRRDDIAARDPQAFTRKIQVAPNGNGKHKRGCNCRKSHCLKKYCECYQGGVKCGIQCSCMECENMDVGSVAGLAEAASGRGAGKRTKNGGRAGGGGSRAGSRRSSATGMFDDYYEQSPQMPSTSGCSDGPSPAPSLGTVPASGLLLQHQHQQHQQPMVAATTTATTVDHFEQSAGVGGGESTTAGGPAPAAGSLPQAGVSAATVHALAPGVTQLTGGGVIRQSLQQQQLLAARSRPVPRMTSPLPPQVLQRELQRHPTQNSHMHSQQPQQQHSQHDSPSLVYGTSSQQQQQQQQSQLQSSPSTVHEEPPAAAAAPPPPLPPPPLLPPPVPQQQQHQEQLQQQQRHLNHELELSLPCTSEASRGNNDAATTATTTTTAVPTLAVAAAGGGVSSGGSGDRGGVRGNMQLPRFVGQVMDTSAEMNAETASPSGELNPVLKRTRGLEEEATGHTGSLQSPSGLPVAPPPSGMRGHGAMTTGTTSSNQLQEVNHHYTHQHQYHYQHQVSGNMFGIATIGMQPAIPIVHGGCRTDDYNTNGAVESAGPIASAGVEATNVPPVAPRAAAAMLPPPPQPPAVPRCLDNETRFPPGFTPTAHGMTQDVVSPPPLSLLTHLKCDSDTDDGLQQHAGMRHNPFLSGVTVQPPPPPPHPPPLSLSLPHSASAAFAFSLRHTTAFRRNDANYQQQHQHHDIGGLDVGPMDFGDSPELADVMIAAIAGEASRARAGGGECDVITTTTTTVAAAAAPVLPPPGSAHAAHSDRSQSRLQDTDPTGCGSADGGLFCNELLSANLLDGPNDMFLASFEPNSIEFVRASFDSGMGMGACGNGDGSALASSGEFLSPRQLLGSGMANRNRGTITAPSAAAPGPRDGPSPWLHPHRALPRSFRYDDPMQCSAAGSGMVPCGGSTAQPLPLPPPWPLQPSGEAAAAAAAAAAADDVPPMGSPGFPDVPGAVAGVHTLVAPVRTSAGPVLWKRKAAAPLDVCEARTFAMQQGPGQRASCGIDNNQDGVWGTAPQPQPQPQLHHPRTQPSPPKRQRLSSGPVEPPYGSVYQTRHRPNAFHSTVEAEAAVGANASVASAGCPQRSHDVAGSERNMQELRKQEALAYMQGRLGVSTMLHNQQQHPQRLLPTSQHPQYPQPLHHSQQLQQRHPQLQQKQQKQHLQTQQPLQQLQSQHSHQLIQQHPLQQLRLEQSSQQLELQQLQTQPLRQLHPQQQQHLHQQCPQQLRQLTAPNPQQQQQQQQQQHHHHYHHLLQQHHRLEHLQQLPVQQHHNQQPPQHFPKQQGPPQLQQQLPLRPRQAHTHAMHQQHTEQRQQPEPGPEGCDIQARAATANGTPGEIGTSMTMPLGSQPVATGGACTAYGSGGGVGTSTPMKSCAIIEALPPIRSQQSQSLPTQPDTAFTVAAAAAAVTTAPPDKLPAGHGANFAAPSSTMRTVAASAAPKGAGNINSAAGAVAGADNGGGVSGGTVGIAPPGCAPTQLQQHGHSTAVASGAAAAAAPAAGRSATTAALHGPDLHGGAQPLGHSVGACGFRGFMSGGGGGSGGIFVNAHGVGSSPVRVRMKGVMKLCAGSTFVLSPNNGAASMG